MPVRIVVSMQPAPGKRDALIAAFAALCPNVQEEPGCQQYEVYQSLENPDRLVLLEKWETEEALAVHQGRMQERRDQGLDLDALRSGREVERYTE
ncbi:MAG: antibiotic biosynthesis monooxygenase [Candidatus Tectomicrobia bacterium]|nr:antibiotic biosynthesis monooxygenase [Candidatus Tectomicrobia bacterium]